MKPRAGTMPYPSKHKTFVQHLYNGGPMTKTLGRRGINVIQMFCVFSDSFSN